MSCVQTSPGLCKYGNEEISCSLIRECSPITGRLFYEYAMPNDTGNVNIYQANLNGEIVGYRNSSGNVMEVPKAEVSVYEEAYKKLAMVPQVLSQAYQSVVAPLLPNTSPVTSNVVTGNALVASDYYPKQTEPTIANTMPQGQNTVNQTIGPSSNRPEANTITSVSLPNTGNVPPLVGSPITLNQQAVNKAGLWLHKAVSYSAQGVQQNQEKLGNFVNPFLDRLVDSSPLNEKSANSIKNWLEDKTLGIDNTVLVVAGVLIGGYLIGNQRSR